MHPLKFKSLKDSTVLHLTNKFQFFIGGCPTSHPYAYLNGDYCCQTNEELTNGGTQSEKDSGTCDGINFNEQSTCCKNHGFIPCPSANGCSTGTLTTVAVV